ncbi:hypothetical protein GCM10010193_62450 [Kitasatospora atroaurantiaca]|uniref:Uncharacterized protein n=1 Tax=Kitasatospora atroaurantiaca TaxID=285545 RepID=A0A561F1U3_9ACTN|nr:hypothetical protein [Kitasatospora atroaurantiaca]TWE21834.1 hypothetical protein FB465_7066 [Kitasatospora atroaurantiaca]
MDPDQVADHLYSLPPDEFTAAREAAAGQAVKAGDRALARQIRALRKPTTAAWMANQLTRRHPEQMSTFTDLGRSLRQAQEQLSGEQLRELLAQRRRLVAALVAQAREDARAGGHRIGDGPEQELAETLQAALADEQAAQDLAAGRLTTALHPGSSPALPATSAGRPRAPAAVPARPARPAPDRKRARAAEPSARLEKLRREAEQLRADAADAEHQAQSAADQAEELEHRAEAAEHDAAEAEAVANRARTALETAEADLQAARAAARTAREQAAAAARTAVKARTGADDLTKKLTGLDARLARSSQ